MRARAHALPRIDPRQGLWVPAVFGPYKGYSNGTSGKAQPNRSLGARGDAEEEEGHADDEYERRQELEEMADVLAGEPIIGSFGRHG